MSHTVQDPGEAGSIWFGQSGRRPAVAVAVESPAPSPPWGQPLVRLGICLPTGGDHRGDRSWAPMADADLPSFHGIIGRSVAMQALFRRIKRVAPIDVPVLIQGESGTGKELVASAIHALSRRASTTVCDGPCSACRPFASDAMT